MGPTIVRTRGSSYSVKCSRAYTEYFVINMKEESFRLRPAFILKYRQAHRLVLRIISILSHNG